MLPRTFLSASCTDTLYLMHASNELALAEISTGIMPMLPCT